MSTGSILGKGLGVLSVGLGAAQVLLPHRLLKTVGVRTDDPAPGVVRAIGVRELVAGGGLLAMRRPTPFAWFRVVGDVMDLALMGSVAARRGLRKDRATAALGLAGLVSVADLAAGVLLAREASKGGDRAATDGERAPLDGAAGATPVRAAVTIDRSRQEVYAAWRRLEELPRFMRHLESVTETADGRTHWVATGPGGTTVSWDATVTEDRPGERIAWAAVPGSQVRNAGVVTFTDAPGGRGTEVRVELAYEPPAGPLGALVAKVTGEEPGLQVPDDLRRFKQLLETGTIAVAKDDAPGTIASPAQPTGTGRRPDEGSTPDRGRDALFGVDVAEGVPQPVEVA
ncbi:MAG TPA: SRPBCC family protein [Candidatus Limnocylindrales bacterium]|nr:SRPBCC family protein [Candidatus Limnocylindrales bacterium]